MPRMMRSSRFAVLVIAVLLLGTTSCTMWGEKKTNSWKTVTAGEELTRLYWQEVKQKNWTELSNHMSATLVGLNSGGTLDRESMMSHVRKMEITDFQIGEVQTQSSGEHLLVTYKLAVNGTSEGRPLPQTMRFMSVWQLVKSGWVLVAQTAVPVSES
jgi:Domain of unknown function (DUF4440)